MSNENENEFTLHLKNPPKRIFAYQHSSPGGQIMGVAISAETGKILEAVILPTKQRVMLGLGIGNTDAQAHASYRRYGGKQGYELIWLEDPETDPRAHPLKDRLVSKAQEQIAEAHKPIQEQDNVVGELTAQLVKQGALQAQAQEREDAEVEAPSKDSGGFF